MLSILIVHHRKKKRPDLTVEPFQIKNSGNVLLSHTVPRAVPSALEGLTSEFGMDIGCAPSAIIAGNLKNVVAAESHVHWSGLNPKANALGIATDKKSKRSSLTVD